MKAFALLKVVCRAILPFILLLGFFIILNGDISPGGGFQGGVVLASTYLVVYFISEDRPIPFARVIRLEKGLFVTLILSGVLMMTTYQFLWETIDPANRQLIMELGLIYLNLLIGAKVALGLSGIMVIFIEEGNP